MAQMEFTNRVKIVFNQIHFLDELGDELDERVELVANFPSALTHDFREQVSLVRDAQHRVSEVRVAND